MAWINDAFSSNIYKLDSIDYNQSSTRDLKPLPFGSVVEWPGHLYLWKEQKRPTCSCIYFDNKLKFTTIRMQHSHCQRCLKSVQCQKSKTADKEELTASAILGAESWLIFEGVDCKVPSMSDG